MKKKVVECMERATQNKGCRTNTQWLAFRLGNTCGLPIMFPGPMLGQLVHDVGVIVNEHAAPGMIAAIQSSDNHQMVEVKTTGFDGHAVLRPAEAMLSGTPDHLLGRVTDICDLTNQTLNLERERDGLPPLGSSFQAPPFVTERGITQLAPGVNADFRAFPG